MTEIVSLRCCTARLVLRLGQLTLPFADFKIGHLLVFCPRRTALFWSKLKKSMSYESYIMPGWLATSCNSSSGSALHGWIVDKGLLLGLIPSIYSNCFKAYCPILDEETTYRAAMTGRCWSTLPTLYPVPRTWARGCWFESKDRQNHATWIFKFFYFL